MTIVYLVIGVPLLLSLYFTLKLNFLSTLIFGMTAFFLIMLVIDFMLGNKIFEPRPVHANYFIFFVVLALTSMVNGVRSDIPTTILQLKELAGVFVWSSVFLIMYYAVENLHDISLTMRILNWTGIAISVSVYVAYLLGFAGVSFGDVQISRLGSIRAFGPLGDQVGFVVLLFVFRALLAKNWPLFAFHMCALLATGTRGALVAFVVGFLVNLFIRIPQEKDFPLRKLLAPSLVSIVLISALFFTPIGKSFLDRILNPAQLSIGFSTRTGSMYLGYLVFKDHPLTGVGFNGFRNVVWDYSPGGLFDILIENYTALTANQYVQTAVDGGIVGLLAFLFLIAYLVRSMLRASRETDGRLALDFKSFFVWSVAILIGNQTSVWLLQHSIICHYFFVLSGLAERAIEIRTRPH